MQRYFMNTSYLQDRLKAVYQLHKRTITNYTELVDSLNEECSNLCDIIPNYRISATLEQEDGQTDQRKKKEVFKIQKLEHEVLIQYEHFLELLRKLSKKSHPEQQALGSRLCARLVCSAAPEFNHAEALLKLAVNFSNSKSTRVAQPCINALFELLDGQMVSDATEHVVAALLDIVRKRSYAMNPKLLNVLLHIRVAMVDMHRSDFTEEKAKNKRLKKEDKELARQMQKAKARRDRAELAVKQTRIIHRIFVIYLRVLEASRSCSPAHKTKILAPTLEGLLKFAPLINVELYQQLMEALKDLVSDEETSVTTKLHALVAVAALTQKDVNASSSQWSVDLTYFHEVLFCCLPQALTLPKVEGRDRSKMTQELKEDGEEAAQGDEDEVSSRASLSSLAFSVANSMAQGSSLVHASAMKEWTFNVNLVLRAVDMLVLSHKHLSVVRVTAYVRRLVQFIPSCPPHAAMSLLVLVHRLLLRYPLASGIILGGNDNIIGGRGLYNPEALQTLSSNADASFTWELSSLTHSYHPTLRQLVDTFCKHYHRVSKCHKGEAHVVAKQLNALGPYEVLEEYDPSLGNCKPYPPLPKALRAERISSLKRLRDDDN